MARTPAQKGAKQEVANKKVVTNPKRQMKSADKTSPGRKKKRKKKDPNAPKRAQSAYLLFMGSVRADVVSQFPNYKIGEIAQHIGGMWRALPAKIKAPFERRAAELRAQYLEDRRVYLLNKTDPNKPKRPQSSYFLFMATVRSKVKAENPDFSIAEIAKLIGHMWKNLSEEEKAPFMTQAVALKETYREAMAEYEESV
jgi:hypothetical protein